MAVVRRVMVRVAVMGVVLVEAAWVVAEEMVATVVASWAVEGWEAALEVAVEGVRAAWQRSRCDGNWPEPKPSCKLWRSSSRQRAHPSHYWKPTEHTRQQG